MQHLNLAWFGTPDMSCNTLDKSVTQISCLITYTHSCPTDLDNYSRAVQPLIKVVMLPSESRKSILTLDTFIAYLFSETWALLNISGKPCNVLLRRDLHFLISYGIVNYAAGIMVWMNTLQDIFRHYSSPCYVMLRNFYAPTRY